MRAIIERFDDVRMYVRTDGRTTLVVKSLSRLKMNPFLGEDDEEQPVGWNTGRIS